MGAVASTASQREYLYDICKRALRQFDHMSYGPIDIVLRDWVGKSLRQLEIHASGPAHCHCMAAIRNTNFYGSKVL